MVNRASDYVQAYVSLNTAEAEAVAFVKATIGQDEPARISRRDALAREVVATYASILAAAEGLLAEIEAGERSPELGSDLSRVIELARQIIQDYPHDDQSVAGDFGFHSSAVLDALGHERPDAVH